MVNLLHCNNHWYRIKKYCHKHPYIKTVLIGSVRSVVKEAVLPQNTLASARCIKRHHINTVPATTAEIKIKK